jgi:regulatory protein
MGDEQDRSVAKAEATAYRLLARRDHGRGELAKKLADRGYDAEMVRELLDRLEEVGYLDDRRFAVHQAEVLARKQWGPRRIQEKLEARGIDAGLVSEILDEIEDEVSFVDAARDRLIRRFGEPVGLERAICQKAYRHLIHRGYSPALVRGLLFDG